MQEAEEGGLPSKNNVMKQCPFGLEISGKFSQGMTAVLEEERAGL